MREQGSTATVVAIGNRPGQAETAKSIACKFAWIRAFGLSEDLSATTKLVLHTLAVPMDLDGNRSRWAIATIAKHASLSRSAVKKHIALARKAGWLEVQARRDASGDPTSNAYRPVIPFDESEGGEGHQVTGVGHDVAVGGSPGDPGDGHDVAPTNKLTNQLAAAREDNGFEESEAAAERDLSLRADALRRRFCAVIGNPDGHRDEVHIFKRWLKARHDPDRHILPAAETYVRRGNRGQVLTTVNYFNGMIAEIRAKVGDGPGTHAAAGCSDAPGDTDWQRAVDRVAGYREKHPHRSFETYPPWLWSTSLGPPPWDAGCEAPVDILKHHGFRP